MTGIHLPLPPTDGGNGTSATPPATPAGSPPATSPGIAPVGPTAPTPSGRGVLITLIALVVGMLLVLVSTLWGTAQLRQQADRLATELERFTGAAAPSQVLPPEEAYGYPDEVFEDDFPFDAEPEPLFLETQREERTVAGAARYEFDARAGDLLSVTVASERETTFAVLELSDGRGTYLAFAERGGGRFGPAGAGSSGALELWYRFDTDGTYILTYHSELLWGEDDLPEVLTAALHDGSGAELVIDLDAEYPTDGSLPTYGFDAQEGQLAVITMRSLRPEVLDPLVRVYGPDGQLIGMDDDGGGWPDARLTVRLPHDGRYEVEADTFLGEPPRGSRAHGYTLTVELIEVS